MLLAIDTATRLLSLALADDDRLLAEWTWETANQHSVELSPAIARILATASLTTTDLRVVAVAQGPGSFTGVRIGLGVAKGLATALGIPLIPVSTLDVVATGTPYFEGQLLAVIQAGRGRVVAAPYQWTLDRWQAVGEMQLYSWQELLETVQVESLVNGEIDRQGLSWLEQSVRPVQVAATGLRLRRAGFLAQLARQTPPQNPVTVLPVYVKPPGDNAP